MEIDGYRMFKEVHLDEWLVMIDRAQDEAPVESRDYSGWQRRSDGVVSLPGSPSCPPPWTPLYLKYAPADLLTAAVKHLPRRYALVPQGPYNGRVVPVFPTQLIRFMFKQLSLMLSKYAVLLDRRYKTPWLNYLFPDDWTTAPASGVTAWMSYSGIPTTLTIQEITPSEVRINMPAPLRYTLPCHLFGTQGGAVRLIKAQNDEITRIAQIALPKG